MAALQNFDEGQNKCFIFEWLQIRKKDKTRLKMLSVNTRSPKRLTYNDLQIKRTVFCPFNRRKLFRNVFNFNILANSGLLFGLIHSWWLAN